MAEIKWHRIMATAALIVSVVLIGGSIYLHVRQKPHFGRLSYEKRTLAVDGVDATFIVTPITTSTDNEDLLNASSASNNRESSEYNDYDTKSGSSSEEIYIGEETYIERRNARRAHYITEACMQCICETTNECKPATCGDGQSCGLFRITRAYWKDAEEPILESSHTFQTGANDLQDYLNCINNPYCAARTVSAYMRRYARDCNHDGVVNCTDFIAIHALGPSGCMQNELPAVLESRMQKCFAKLY